PQRELRRLALALIEPLDARAHRPAPAGFDRGGDRLRRAGKHRLDRAVAPVAHPTCDAALERLMFDKGAETDALHAPTDRDMAQGVHALAPDSMTRAPVKRERDQRSMERT